MISRSNLADQLEPVIQDKSVDKHHEALTSAIQNYADCQDAIMDRKPDDIPSKGRRRWNRQT